MNMLSKTSKIFWLALIMGTLPITTHLSQQPQHYEKPPRYDREEPHAECRSAGGGWTSCTAKSVWEPAKGAAGIQWSVATPGGEFILRGMSIVFRPVGNVVITLHARGREIVVWGDPDAECESVICRELKALREKCSPTIS